MAYIPDVSGFMKPLGDVTSLSEILNKNVPKQLELTYKKQDISEFDPDMRIQISARDGYKVRLFVNVKLASEQLIHSPSNAFRNCYDRRGYLIKNPVFVFDNNINLYSYIDSYNNLSSHFIHRYIKIQGNISREFILRIWGTNSHKSSFPLPVELIPLPDD